MTFRKHLTQQAPHLMLTFGLGLVLMFALVYDDLLFM